MGLAHSPKIATDGLVLCLDAANVKSYPGTGTAWTDVSANDTNGTLTNGPTFGGGAIEFDGANDYIMTPTNALMDTQTLTMETWCNPDLTNHNGFLFEKGPVNTQFSYFFNSNNVFYFRTIGLSPQDLTFTTTTHITAGNWHQIVATYAAGVKIIYINGIQRYEQTGITGTIATGKVNQYIGAYGPGTAYFFNGKIAISKFYNRALTAIEVQQNFNATRGRYGI